MFKKMFGFVILFICISKGLMAQSVHQSSLTEEQRDFMNRTIAAHTVWKQLLFLIDQLITGKNSQSEENKEQEKKVIEFIAQHPILVFTFAKYFTSAELSIITDFLGSREFKNIAGLISNKLASQDEEFRRDMNALKVEVQAVFRRVKEQMQGKSSSTLFTLPPLEFNKNNPFEDRTSSLEKSLAARQLLEAILPLAENITRRKLRAAFKKEVEGVKISIAVSQLKENFKEHPMIIASLVEYLDIKELNKTIAFFSNKEVYSMVERISQQISSENDQFRRDIQRCLFELTWLPFLQGKSGLFQNMFSSFLGFPKEILFPQRKLFEVSPPERTVTIHREKEFQEKKSKPSSE